LLELDCFAWIVLFIKMFLLFVIVYGSLLFLVVYVLLNNFVVVISVTNYFFLH
jgi:hypothetical protein